MKRTKIIHKPKINAHLDGICKKAGQKENSLSRATAYMNLLKWRVRFNEDRQKFMIVCNILRSSLLLPQLSYILSLPKMFL